MNKSISLLLTFILLITAPFLNGCGSKESSADTPDTDVPAQKQITERFNLRNTIGQRHHWSEYVGKPLIINFWATWCGPCRAEIPGMINIYKEYQPQGLEIVAISLDDQRTKDRVVPFIDQFQIPWVVLYGDQAVVNEFQPGASIPVSIFFDSQGNETARLVGAQPEANFRREVEKLFPATTASE